MPSPDHTSSCMVPWSRGDSLVFLNLCRCRTHWTSVEFTTTFYTWGCSQITRFASLRQILGEWPDFELFRQLVRADRYGLPICSWWVLTSTKGLLQWTLCRSIYVLLLWYACMPSLGHTSSCMVPRGRGDSLVFLNLTHLLLYSQKHCSATNSVIHIIIYRISNSNLPIPVIQYMM